MIEALVQALQNFGSSGIWIFTFLGIATGILFGIIPGIGILVAMALFLPFVFKLAPVDALPFLVACSSVGYQGGVITSILLNIPGEETSAATLLDGFPMTQKGEAGRAIGAGLMASGFGGIVAAFLALLMIPLILPMVLTFGAAEMVFLILTGIMFIGVLGSGSMIKGLISGFAGLLISLIGFAPSGVPRFTFGSVYLYSGISLVPLILGIFSIPECLSLAMSGTIVKEKDAQKLGSKSVLALGLKDVLRNWWLTLRCTVIGYIIGVIPGIGASTAIFIAYGHAKQTSKNPETFGTGNVQGVIAPQSASNGVSAGSLLTTCALGVPGSATGALLLGAFLTLGIVPGPEMMADKLDLTLTMVFVIVVANIIATMMCAPLASSLAKVATVPARILFPLILVVAFIGVYAFREQFVDVIVTLVFGLLGLPMVWYGFNRAALMLGFVLGNLFEHYLVLAVKINGPFFFTRPVCLILIAVMMFSILRGPIGRSLRKRRTWTGGQAV